ncbi:MIP/aquaporin family protein [Nocardiopsis baichengensis]|uniref:MIP/aquaporin family protein n=1 Tax=Nocardiopsis baichengensis TaxID=280240 RepID=UPI000347A123|nr:aquaporin [Nocardiopsis baichengensis]
MLRTTRRAEGPAAPRPTTGAPPRGPALALLRLGLLEFLITAAMFFFAASAVRWVFATDSPLSEPLAGPPAMILFGLMFGAANTVVIHFSMTRRTAGHMNPSVSIGLWLMRVIPGRNVAPMCLAQMVGSVAGVAASGPVWGEVMRSESVRYAVISPAPGWTTPAVLAVETAAQFGCMTIVAALLLRPRLKWLIPVAVGSCIASFIIFLGPLAGGSVNPARQFGPAVMSGQYDHLSAYLIGPIAGAVLAAVVAAVLRPPARTGAPEETGDEQSRRGDHGPQGADGAD